MKGLPGIAQAVNEGDDPVQTFISGSEDTFIDHLALFNDEPSLPDILQPDKLDEYEIIVDQQPTKKSSLIPKGITIRWHSNNERKLCQIISSEHKNGINTCKVKVLGSQDVVTLSQSSVEPVCAPDPSAIPKDIEDIDIELLQKKLSEDDIKKIWDKKDTTYDDDEKLFLYWHQRTRYTPIEYVKILALRWVIPRRLAKIKRIPKCAPCKLADATKRNWKTSSSKMGIRNGRDAKPGAGTSCGHLISHEPGLMPQVTERLTHGRYCRAAVFTDHFSDIISPT